MHAGDQFFCDTGIKSKTSFDFKQYLVSCTGMAIIRPETESSELFFFDTGIRFRHHLTWSNIWWAVFRWYRDVEIAIIRAERLFVKLLFWEIDIIRLETESGELCFCDTQMGRLPPFDLKQQLVSCIFADYSTCQYLSLVFKENVELTVEYNLWIISTNWKIHRLCVSKRTLGDGVLFRLSRINYIQLHNVHPVPKFRSCHKAIMVITVRAHCCTFVYTTITLQYKFTSYINLFVLGNLPVEQAKDAVRFLQRCGVSLVSSYAVCFLQRGGVSLASSAIIYNIVKVKVTRWPVWAVDPWTHWPIDPLTLCAFCSRVAWAWRCLLSYIL